ncbi:hypothetical protein Tco_1376106 [Tanacetum coccineum]
MDMLYDSCGVHHVSTEKGIDIYMLVEKEYPLSRGTLTLMLVAKLLVDQDNEMSRELLRKIFMQPRVSTAQVTTASTNQLVLLERNYQEEPFTYKEEIDLETAQTTTTTKLPILNQENGNSFKPAAQTTTNADGTSTSLIPGPVTTEEKVQKKIDVKARSMLLMTLPNEHLMTFNQYKDAKTLFAAIQKRFGGNEATKKTQKTLFLTGFRRFTNEVNTAYGVSTANLSDATVYAFLASQPNGSQLVHENLEQIHEDDLEKMYLKWSDTAGYDKSKVECFNCHKMRYFARECRGTRNQDSRNKNQDNSKRTVNVEETSSKAMVAIDGAGFDWSYMADNEVPTNMALMVFSDSEITDKSRKGVGFISYNAVPPPHTGLFSPPTLDLSNSGLEEFQQPKFEGYRPKTSKSVSEDISNEVREYPNAPLVEELVSDDKLEKKTIFPTADCNYHQRERVVSGNNYIRANYNYFAKKAHPSAHKNMASRAVLMKTGLRPLNNVKIVNTAHLKTTVYRPNSAVVNVVRANQTSRILMEDMLPLEEEPKEGKLLNKWHILICKKQTVVATSSTEAEYVAAASCCGQGPVVQGEGSTYLVESPTQTLVVDEAASTGVDVRYGGDTTTVTGLEAGQGSANIDKTPTMPLDLPLLRKPEGSEGFHQLVDFLNSSHIRKLDNGEIELTATIDGKVKTVTEASIRRHLQLADADGISSLPTTKIFEQLSFMGEIIPLFPAMIVQGPVVQDEAASTGVDVRYGGATTTVTGLEAGHGSGNIDKTPTMPHDSPLPRGNTLGSNEGSMTQQELMVFCTTLSKKVESLETDLKQTKQIYGAAYTRLIKKVKKLEKTAKSSQARRRARIVISDDEDDLDDPSKQGRKIAEIDQDPAFHWYNIMQRFRGDVSTALPISTAGAAVTSDSVAVSTSSPTRNTRVSTTDDITMGETLVYIKKSAAKDKGKGKIDESKTVKTKTKLQQEQERLDFEAAVRLQAELEEEERQRIARVHEAASSFNVEEWEDIQARVEADEETYQLEKRYFAAQRAKERRNKPPTQAQQRTYMSNYIKNMGGYTLQQLRGYSFDEIKTLFETTMRKVNIFVLIESEVDRAVPELAAVSSKRAAEEELDQESSKRQKTGESS